jgi:acyl dehydratase
MHGCTEHAAQPETGAELGAPGERYFEDYPKGAVFRLGPIVVDEDELLAFARRFDPQPIHTDPAAAAAGPFGGLIASGWHTAGLMMRLLAQEFLSPASSLGSPGIDELRWVRPVRPGDRLSVEVTVLEAQVSRSKPNRGILTSRIEVRTQTGEVVMTLQAVNLVARRPSAAM